MKRGDFGDQQRGHVSVSCGALVTPRLSDENAGDDQQGQGPGMHHHSELLGFQTSSGIKTCITGRPRDPCLPNPLAKHTHVHMYTSSFLESTSEFQKVVIVPRLWSKRATSLWLSYNHMGTHCDYPHSMRSSSLNSVSHYKVITIE